MLKCGNGKVKAIDGVRDEALEAKIERFWAEADGG
jgi:hypothetical protein